MQNTGAPVDVASFSFEIAVAAGSGVSFTGADINTSVNTYIFAGNSAQGPDIATLTGTTLDASDNAASGSTTLGTNSSLALGRVFFDVASAASVGAVTLSLTPYPATGLTDPNLANIPIDTLNGGTITITSSGVVPEPSAPHFRDPGIAGRSLARSEQAAAEGLTRLRLRPTSCRRRWLRSCLRRGMLKASPI